MTSTADAPAQRPSGALWRRIAVAVIGVTAVTTLGAGAIAWFTTRTLVIRAIDAQLEDRAGFFRRGVPDALLSGRFRAPSENATEFTQIFEAGTSLWKSDTLVDGDLGAGLAADGPATVILADGSRLRTLALETTVRQWRRRGPPNANDDADDDRDARRVTVVLGESLAETDAQLTRLAWTLGGLWVLATGLAGLAALSLKGAVLRPVQRLAGAIAAIDPVTLTPRVEAAQAPRELAVVVDRLQALLSRVDGVIAREKATIGHIAHELRTPIAGLRTTLEFALAREPGEADARTYQRCLGVVESLQRQIETLLTLTRLEAGSEVLTVDEVDLASLIRRAWCARNGDAEARQQVAAWQVAKPLTLRSGKAQVEAVLRNLIDNAIDHAPAGSTITIAADRTDDGVRLRVANPSDLADASQVFEPYWRADTARSEGHSGLGLALCQRLVRLLGGQVTVTADGTTFAIQVDLPDRV